MLSFEANERFSSVYLSIETEVAVSYPMILPQKEVFFTYECKKTEEGRWIYPLELFCRNLQSNEISRAACAECFSEEELQACLSETLGTTSLKGEEAFLVEQELLDCYEQIWQDYYRTEDEEQLLLQKKWRELFELLVAHGALKRLYLLVGKEMFGKEIV